MLFAQSTCLDLGLDATEERLANALAATADLENVRLCEKEPVGSDFSGALYRAWEPKP